MASGSVLCHSCRKLVGVNDEECYYCGQKNPGKPNLLRGIGKGVDQVGLEKVVIGICVLLYLASLVWDINGIQSGGFNFLSPSIGSLFLFGASGSVPVFEFGRWWTVLSASLLHGGLLHIGLNMYWLNMFLPVTRHVYGSSRTIMGFTASSIGGFLLTSFMGLFMRGTFLSGASFTIGASAAIFGLLGLMVASGGALGRVMKTNALLFAVFSLIFPGVDHYAHLGGFIGGYLAGVLFQKLPENPKLENIIAVLCMVAFAASVIVSVIVNLAIAQNIGR